MNLHKLKHTLPAVVLIILSPFILLWGVLVYLLAFLDPKARVFDKGEAREVLTQEMEKFKQQGFEELRKRFIDESEIYTDQIELESGAEYQIEIQGFWDDKSEEIIRIIGGIDNGGLSAFSPMPDSFIMRSDGSFVD